jgi:phage protein U
MLMVLGQFVWSINTVAYQELKRKTDWRYASNNRVSKRPATQYVGLGSDKITVSGWFSSTLAGDPASIDKLRLMADAGVPYVLVSGTGAVFGLYEIESITENTSLFYPNGTPRRIDFTLSINRVDDDQIDQVGLINDAQDIFL